MSAKEESGHLFLLKTGEKKRFTLNSSHHDTYKGFQLFINMPGLQLQFT